MQLVRVPRLLECLILRVEVRGWGLQDSLGRSRVPEKSLFTAYLIPGSWSGSGKRSCSDESHCLWDTQKQEKNKSRQKVSELSVSSLKCCSCKIFETNKHTQNLIQKWEENISDTSADNKGQGSVKANIHYFWRFDLISGPETHTITLDTKDGCHGEIVVGIRLPGQLFQCQLLRETDKRPCFLLHPVT